MIYLSPARALALLFLFCVSSFARSTLVAGRGDGVDSIEWVDTEDSKRKLDPTTLRVIGALPLLLAGCAATFGVELFARSRLRWLGQLLGPSSALRLRARQRSCYGPLSRAVSMRRVHFPPSHAISCFRACLFLLGCQVASRWTSTSWP